MHGPDITTVARSGLANSVVEVWERANEVLLEARASYFLNLSFYLGHQWIWWDRERQTVQSLVRKNDLERVRAVVNIIRPRINTLLGRLTTRSLSFEVNPSGVDDATLSAARISEHVLRARHNDDGWEELRADNLFGLLMGGTTLLMVDWDPDSDEAVFDSYNIAEFTLEPGCRRPRDSRYMILARALPPKQIKARYDLSFEPSANSSRELSPLHRRLLNNRGLVDQVDLGIVYQYIERPYGKTKGRVATVVDDQVIEYEDWPYPFDTLPGYVFRADQVPQQWNGDTPMNGARSIQAAYNQIRSTMLENAKLAGNPRILSPIGAGLDDFEWSDEPGEVVPYVSDGAGSKPEWMSAPSLPRDFRYETERLTGEMDDILFTHATSRGQAPGDRNSGLALSILAEKDDTPLGRVARDQQHGWQVVTSQALQLYATKVTKPRSARVTGIDAIPVSIQWTGKMLGEQSDVMIPLDSVMPHSRAATQAMVVELKQSFPELFQGLDRAAVLRILDLPSADRLAEAVDDDVACAMWENTMMAQGEIMRPEPWHDHAVHMANHNRERNGQRYRYATPDIRRVIDLHIMAHEAMIREEMAETQALNAAQPGLGAMPRANEPVGSLMPRDAIDAHMAPMPALPAGPRPPA